MSEQLPRADISNETDRIIKKLNDVQWNKRKEGIEELDKLLAQNGNRIQINGLADLFNLVKTKMGDQNKGVIRPMISIVGRLAEACGKDFKVYGKQLIPGLIGYLSDK